MTDAARAISDSAEASSPRLRTLPSSLHSGIRVATFISLQILATLFPLLAGFIVFGWRAIGTTLVVTGTSLGTMLLLRRIGWRGRQIRLSHTLWLSTIVALMLPAHLFTLDVQDGTIVWPILAGAGVTLALLNWLLGGLGAQRVPPAIVTILLLFVFFHELLTPRFVLRVDHLFIGDLLNAGTEQQSLSSQTSWLVKQPATGFDAIRLEPTGDKLLAYTSAQQRPDRSSLTMQMLIRDQMPPLENLVIGGESNAIGSCSAIAVIIGGLFLLYQGLIDFRIPLFGVLSAFISLLVLPIPVLITDTATEWRWLAFREHYLGLSTAVTFVNYEILASPLLLTLFFIATAPGLRPITKRGRSIWAILLGFLAAVFQLYATMAVGPYVALLIVSLLTPTLDRIMRARPLV